MAVFSSEETKVQKGYVSKLPQCHCYLVAERAGSPGWHCDCRSYFSSLCSTTEPGGKIRIFSTS